MSEYWNIAILECRNTGVSEFLDDGVVDCLSIGM